MLAPLMRLLLARPLVRAGMLFLGYRDLSVQTKPQQTIQLPQNSPVPRGSILAGDVIIANHSSFVDVLFLYVMFDAAFLRCGIEVSGFT